MCQLSVSTHRILRTQATRIITALAEKQRPLRPAMRKQRKNAENEPTGPDTGHVGKRDKMPLERG